MERRVGIPVVGGLCARSAHTRTPPPHPTHTPQLALIYIQEAHAIDEWPIASARMSRVGLGPPTAEGAGGSSSGVKAAGAPVSIAQHKSLAERLAAARSFVADYGVPLRIPESAPAAAVVTVVCDDISNGFQNAFAAWPIRWYAFALGADGGAVVTHIGQPDGSSYDLYEVSTLLEAMAVPPA